MSIVDKCSRACYSNVRMVIPNLLLTRCQFPFVFNRPKTNARNKSNGKLDSTGVQELEAVTKHNRGSPFWSPLMPMHGRSGLALINCRRKRNLEQKQESSAQRSLASPVPNGGTSCFACISPVVAIEMPHLYFPYIVPCLSDNHLGRCWFDCDFEPAL